MDKGYLQVYTGNGKGKTTAAFGVALRAVGAGYKTFIAQFVKGMYYSELDALKRFGDYITIKQYGRGCFIKNKPTSEDITQAQQGLKEATLCMSNGNYQLVILDEANIAVYFSLFTITDLCQSLDKRHFQTEVIITGRYAHQDLLQRADLVTEMREVKHYYSQGIQARKGIEK